MVFHSSAIFQVDHNTTCKNAHILIRNPVMTFWNDIFGIWPCHFEMLPNWLKQVRKRFSATEANDSGFHILHKQVVRAGIRRDFSDSFKRRADQCFGMTLQFGYVVNAGIRPVKNLEKVPGGGRSAAGVGVRRCGDEENRRTLGRFERCSPPKHSPRLS